MRGSSNLLPTGPIFGHKTCLSWHAWGSRQTSPAGHSREKNVRGSWSLSYSKGWLCLAQYLSCHYFINRLLQPNRSQEAVMAEGYICFLGCLLQAGLLGFCLVTFPLDNWACVMAYACAVIKNTVLISVAQLWNPCLFPLEFIGF